LISYGLQLLEFTHDQSEELLGVKLPLLLSGYVLGVILRILKGSLGLNTSELMRVILDLIMSSTFGLRDTPDLLMN
jgi:hypothetical protein